MKPLSDTALQPVVNTMARLGNTSATARELGLPRATVQSQLEEAERRGMKPGKAVDNVNDPDYMRQKMKRMEVELKAAKSKALDEQAIRDTIIKLAGSVAEIATPTWVTAPKGVTSSPGVPTLFLSDLHWGEVVKASQINGVNMYNLKIAQTRLQAAFNGAVDLLQIISPKMDYPGLVLILGGDMISGNIHDELATTNELNTMPTVLDLYGTLVGLITQAADRFGRVFLPCVTGNHGRDTHKIWNKDRHATSFDWLLYCFLAKHFEADKRVTFFIPDGPDAYYRVYNHRFLLTHGDQFRGGDGVIGALGPIIRGDHRKRSRNGQIDMAYDTLLMGHWHQYMHLTRLIVNGSLKGYDEYAYNNNFGFEMPQQALWINHPKHGITFRMPVHVDRLAAPSKAEWVSVK